ncbi:MAG: alanine dehydrogenase [Bacteroidota bacterium]
MDIGILKEDGINERRVALSPVGVQTLIGAGNTVYIEKQAGSSAVFQDEEYRDAGALISYSAEEVINRSQMVLKVSPPTDFELSMFSPGQVMLSFLHLAVSQRRLIEILLERKVTAVSYELIENSAGVLSVLQVMSEIAGQLAIQVGAHHLQGREGGRGILLGSIPGVPPASVVILGAGTVGKTSARVALGMGANVTVLDREVSRLRELEHLFQWRITTAMATKPNIAKAVRFADLVVGAVLLKGEKAPHLVTEDMVKDMKVGSVIVDASIDQGGCVETSRLTSIGDPVFIRHGVIHYCVPNMTASVARTATAALTNALLPYLMEITDGGLLNALRRDPGLVRGVCTYDGNCTNEAVAKVFDLKPAQLSYLVSGFTKHSSN